MTNNEPEFKNFTDVPVQLFFFYNYITHKISFSSSSLDIFFEAVLNLQQDPPFLKAFDGMHADFLATEWKSSLLLKENETRNFTISLTSSIPPLFFCFTVVKPAPGGNCFRRRISIRACGLIPQRLRSGFGRREKSPM